MADRKKSKNDSEDLAFIKSQIDALTNLAAGCVPENLKQVKIKIGKRWKYNDGVIEVAPMKTEEGYDAAKGNLNHELSHSRYTDMVAYKDALSRSRDDKLFRECLNVVEDIHAELKQVKRFAGADYFMSTAIERGFEQHGSKWLSGGEWRQRLLYAYAKARGYDVLTNALPKEYEDMDGIIEELKKIPSSGEPTQAAARQLAEYIRYTEEPPSKDEGESEGKSKGESEGKSKAADAFEGSPDLDIWSDIGEGIEGDVDHESLVNMMPFDRKLYWFHVNDMGTKYSAAASGSYTWSGSLRFDESKVSLTARKMFRKISDLFKNETRVRKLKGYKSGRLHCGSLHKIRNDDFNVFTRKRRNAKSSDFAMTLLVDCSGSMVGGGKVEHARATTYCVAETLHRIGVKFNIVAFSSLHSRETFCDEPCLITLKDFSESWKGKAERLRYIEAVKENYDGFCLMHVYQRLMHVSARNHIIFVISDGYPCPEDSSVLRQVVKSIEDNVIIVGLGLSFGGVRNFYKNHVICGPESLPEETAKVLKRVLRLDEIKKHA